MLALLSMMQRVRKIPTLVRSVGTSRVCPTADFSSAMWNVSIKHSILHAYCVYCLVDYGDSLDKWIGLQQASMWSNSFSYKFLDYRWRMDVSLHHRLSGSDVLALSLSSCKRLRTEKKKHLIASPSHNRYPPVLSGCSSVSPDLKTRIIEVDRIRSGVETKPQLPYAMNKASSKVMNLLTK